MTATANTTTDTSTDATTHSTTTDATTNLHVCVLNQRITRQAPDSSRSRPASCLCSSPIPAPVTPLSLASARLCTFLSIYLSNALSFFTPLFFLAQYAPGTGVMRCVTSRKLSDLLMDSILSK